MIQHSRRSPQYPDVNIVVPGRNKTGMTRQLHEMKIPGLLILLESRPDRESNAILIGADESKRNTTEITP